MVEPTLLKNMRKSNWMISTNMVEHENIFETTTISEKKHMERKCKKGAVQYMHALCLSLPNSASNVSI